MKDNEKKKKRGFMISTALMGLGAIVAILYVVNRAIKN